MFSAQFPGWKLSDMVKKDAREFYDFLGQYDTPAVHLGGPAATDELLEMCQPDASSQVLVVGCGNGITACTIANRYGSQVMGIDISENMVATATENARKQNLEAKVEFRVADVFDLPFDDGVFDAAIIESVLNLFEAASRPTALNEIVRVIHPGGKVGANEAFALPSTPPEVAESVAELLLFAEPPPTPDDLRELFAGSGLQVIQMTEHPTRDAASIKATIATLKDVGLFSYLSLMSKVLWKMLTDADFRAAGKEMNEGKRIMFRDKNTRDFFGYALMVGQKPE